MMNSRFRKVLWLLLAALLLVGSSFTQRSLNVDRERLGLTRVEPLENAPPVLAFTTVALGGFRGLISNLLWMRATQLQDEDKFFEMQQLADWITKLEPHFSMVWTHQAWNMSYNISVKFKDFSDRWRWVEAGIKLLRDEGLRYNPDDVGMYQQLAWHFQHKMGADLDDASRYYKHEWNDEMNKVLGKGKINWAQLIHPQTDEARERTNLLRSVYKMDPEFMKKLDDEYGPLEWHLPEAHAIYWAALGLERAKEHPTKVKKDDLLQLRRVIYQSMQLSFRRGRLVENPFRDVFDYGPNLDIIPKVNAAYEQAVKDDPENARHIETAHRNFLRDAIYFLYGDNRIEEAAQWYRYLGEHYPDKTMLESDPNSFPRNLTLDDYCVARILENVNETSHDHVRAALENLLARAFRFLIMGDDSKSAGYQLLAKKVWTHYENEISDTGARRDALSQGPFEDVVKGVLGKLLDPENGIAPEYRAVLRAKLGMEPEAAVEPMTPEGSITNTPPIKLQL